MMPIRKIQLFLLVALLTVFAAFAIPKLALGQDGADDINALGAQVYAENCAVCHGLEGEGRVGATLSKDFPSIRPDLATRATIAEGVPGTAMPGWSQENGGPLTEEEIDAVVDFILSWQTGGVPEYPELPTITPHPAISPIPEVDGDPFQGAFLYDFNCKACHGPEGRGRIGASLNKNWGSIRPDLAMRTTIVNGVPGTAMPAWSKDGGGPLTEGEIDDIVAYLLSLPAPEEPVSPTPDSAPTSRLLGWGGVFLTLVIFILIILGILGLQRRKS
jgi:mono/diheme cytochrome c family protein